ncbi:CoA pyrophosphatase [Limnobaculum parvum]|uniref:CoA pyrophosphatase n=1 Tax=Limnobaculum parvum TaxID=2172103 RepID=A0A2Y9TUX8_9GAMM|nr:CoA pyrophosphatase [Limnobaculum parvum]AWH87381.1 CoA pyrophosphatase [Limnobaculum parvum]
MSDTLQHFIQRFQLQLPPPAHDTHQMRKAAVLIPIINGNTPSLLLTKRSAALRKHPGQVAFPGGAMDDTDILPETTALREAYEEVGLNPEYVEIIGQLPALDSVSGFQVTPIVGVLPAGLIFNKNHHEVETLFEVPMDYALNSENYHSIEIIRCGKPLRIYFLHYANNLIWGLTATILQRLSIQVKGFNIPLNNR